MTFVEKNTKPTYLEKNSSVVEGPTTKGKVKWDEKDKNSQYTEDKKSNMNS